VLNMKNALPFTVPFSGMDYAMSFVNCFASVYMFLERKPQPVCRTTSCDSCLKCFNEGQSFFLFDTMCGRTALRRRYDGQPTDMHKTINEPLDFPDGGTENNIDFLFGFAGYDYHKATDNFQAEIAASIDAGKPVIAKAGGKFRVIIGYDGKKLLEPAYKNAGDPPKKALKLEEIDALYLFDEKIEQRFTLKDGLVRIVQVMEYNAREKLWDGFIKKMSKHSDDALPGADIAEKKARMKRVADAMWATFNTHNFMAAFNAPECKHLTPCQQIGAIYDNTHDLAWTLIGLEECADWSQHAAFYFGEMVELVLRQIKKNDEQVFEAVKQALAML